MFRPTATASRAFFRTLSASSQQSALNAALRQQSRSQLCTLSKRPTGVAIGKPLAFQLMRAQASDSRGPMDTINKKEEKKIGSEILKPDPDGVSSDSTIHPVFGEAHSQESGERETDMMAGVKQDLVWH